MKCKTCDYPLWNLPSRICPECGSDFQPSDYEFAQNAIIFCCPHCDQHYYGTSELGHLEPREFECIGCQQHIDMDEMIIKPRQGVSDKQIHKDIHPWLEREQIGRFKAWFQTLGKSLGSPGQLAHTLHDRARLADAFLFFLITTGVAALFYVSTYVLLISLVAFGVSRAGTLGGSSAYVAGAILGGLFGYLVTVLIYIVIWGLITHGLLVVTGGAKRGLGSTLECFGYACGPIIFTAVPCVGGYVLPLAAIWACISGILMIRERQDVSGLRASLTTLTTPLLLIAASVVVVVMLISSIFAATGTMVNTARLSANTFEIELVVDVLVEYAGDHEGYGPDHAVQLIREGSLSNYNFAISDVTESSEITVGGVPIINLEVYMTLNPDRADKMVDEMLQAVAAEHGIEKFTGGVHQLGELIFVYEGINLVQPASPDLWLVVYEEPIIQGMSSTQTRFYSIGLVDGSTVEYLSQTEFDNALVDENLQRMEFGLPLLSNPLLP